MTSEQEGTFEIPEPVQPPVTFAPPVPIESEAVERVAYQPEPEPEVKDELADLFEVPQPEDNDMVTAHLFEVDEIGEDDLSDLTEVSSEDIMGSDYPGLPPAIGEEPMQRTRRVKRTGRRYLPPPMTGMTGIRG